jgi:hypothetical protein
MYTDPSFSGNIINLIKDIEKKHYLELGIADNTNFNGILCKDKKSVDINGRATFTGTTDSFFAGLNDTTSFDVIFIDANHDYDYVLRDFNNCIKHCKEWLVLHDMIPPKLSDTAHTGCSDSYKLLHFLLKERPEIQIFSLEDPIYYGLTFVKMPIERSLVPDAFYANIPYDVFIEEIRKHKLYSKDEMANILSQ